jgi:hypothetical protein
MKEKRHRLNFKQTAKGLIQFDATVEIINPYDEANPEDLAEISKTAANKLAQESLEILQSAEKKFKEAGYEVVSFA